MKRLSLGDRHQTASLPLLQRKQSPGSSVMAAVILCTLIECPLCAGHLARCCGHGGEASTWFHRDPRHGSSHSSTHPPSSITGCQLGAKCSARYSNKKEGRTSRVGGTSGKDPTYQCRRLRDVGSIPGSGRSPGGGHGNPLQCSCLKNPMDRGAWRGYGPLGHEELDVTKVT